MKIINEIERDAPLTNVEKAALGLFSLWPLLAIIAIGALCNGCAYKGGKVVDGTNLVIGMTIPGTEWTINALDYVGGLRVAGNDQTSITVSNEVVETNAYFGIVRTERHSKMTAAIEPTEASSEASATELGALTTPSGKNAVSATAPANSTGGDCKDGDCSLCTDGSCTDGSCNECTSGGSR